MTLSSQQLLPHTEAGFRRFLAVAHEFPSRVGTDSVKWAFNKTASVVKQRLQDYADSDAILAEVLRFLDELAAKQTLQEPAAPLQREIQETEAEHPDSVTETDAATLEHSIDFRTIYFNGERHELTTGQAQIVEFLCKELQNGIPEVHRDRLLEALDSPSSRLRDTFKKSPLWRKLIVQGKRRGTHRLAVARCCSRVKPGDS